jgi:hypothetical protein
VSAPYAIPRPAADRIRGLADARTLAEGRLTDAVEMARAMLGAPLECVVQVDQQTGHMAFVLPVAETPPRDNAA